MKKYLNKKIIFKIPNCFLVISREHWLKKMSLNGWKLINYFCGFYSFKKDKPKNREYYFFVNQSYINNPIYERYKKKDSNFSKKVVEIDIHKIDYYYYNLKNNRNKNLLHNTVCKFKLFFTCLLLYIILMIFCPEFLISHWQKINTSHMVYYHNFFFTYGFLFFIIFGTLYYGYGVICQKYVQFN